MHCQCCRLASCTASLRHWHLRSRIIGSPASPATRRVEALRCGSPSSFVRVFALTQTLLLLTCVSGSAQDSDQTTQSPPHLSRSSTALRPSNAKVRPKRQSSGMPLVPGDRLRTDARPRRGAVLRRHRPSTSTSTPTIDLQDADAPPDDGGTRAADRRGRERSGRTRSAIRSTRRRLRVDATALANIASR